MPTFGYDTETTGVEPYHGDDMFMYSLSTYGGDANAYRLDGSKLRRLMNENLLREFWTRRKNTLVAHNVKFDLTFTEKRLGVPFSGKFHCTLAMAWLLMNLHPHHRLKSLCWELGRIPMDDESLVKKYLSTGYHNAPESLLDDYAARDAFRHMFLFRLFWPEIKADAGMLEAYNAEMALIRPLMDMEARGLRIDPEAMKDLIVKLSRDVYRLERELQLRAGVTFNPESPPQLADVLYNRLGLPVLGHTTTGKPSTAKEYLQELEGKYKIISVLRKFRSYKKAIPILESYLDFADADDIIHSDIMPTGATTGRMSSSRPNLQNVQKEGVLRNPYAVPARRLFIARDGYTNYHFDYKGQELRLLVHYHKDPEYLRLIKEGKDAHKEGVARCFYGKKADIKKYRDAGKNGTFNIGYGGGAKKLSQTLWLSLEKTKDGLARYKERFPNAAGFAKKTAKEVMRKGYVRTELGRKIFINPEAIYTSSANGLIQGTAAEMIKRATVRVSKVVKEIDRELFLLLPVHDELIVEIPDRIKLKKRNEYLREIKRVMEDFPMFEPEMQIDCSKSKVWNKKEAVAL